MQLQQRCEQGTDQQNDDPLKQCPRSRQLDPLDHLIDDDTDNDDIKNIIQLDLRQ